MSTLYKVRKTDNGIQDILLIYGSALSSTVSEKPPLGQKVEALSRSFIMKLTEIVKTLKPERNILNLDPVSVISRNA